MILYNKYNSIKYKPLLKKLKTQKQKNKIDPKSAQLQIKDHI